MSGSITDRFLEAYNDLLFMQTVSGATQFCREIGADRRNFCALQRNPSRHLLRPEWLGGMVEAYGVNPYWLLTGKGLMFGQ